MYATTFKEEYDSKITIDEQLKKFLKQKNIEIIAISRNSIYIPEKGINHYLTIIYKIIY